VPRSIPHGCRLAVFFFSIRLCKVHQRLNDY
jgi:hypothetical protein